ncbi:putative F-box/FBD/LRR-repeat protein At3g59240 [Cornus florida]|uniref:putative F-box/FBD/LRR-repeat protein At3g59240 n=1 Tax=Cornus florida TaxID=4283 RepID=UPI00289BA86F|nr:putative F-box/FBD/LRR-repeat protein At3g59240 [Cornus florida]
MDALLSNYAINTFRISMSECKVLSSIFTLPNLAFKQTVTEVMDSISKRPKHFKKLRVECNEDMISNLPASLIGHILSFLPTKNAVATSVLSTKWKFLWTSITNLDFDDYSLVYRVISENFIFNVFRVCLVSYLLVEVWWLFSSCPVLEDLSMEECNWRNINVLNISAPLLKRLTIKCECYRDSDSKYKIVLNTPNLQDLEHGDYLAEGYSLNELNALVKADIFLDRLPSDVPDRSELAISEIFEGISKVKLLFLWGGWTERFELCRLSLPKFNHLTYLEFHAELDDIFVGCEGLLYFVERSPRLETLIFRRRGRDAVGVLYSD